MTSPIQFTDSSPRFGLPFLFPGQAQKEFFVNQVTALTDILLHPTVEGIGATPPALPVDGSAWIVADSPVGEWAGHSGKIAARQSGDWLFISPHEGLQAYNKAAGQMVIFRDGWISPIKPVQPMGGQTIDSELRALFVSLIESLSIAGIFPVTE